MQKARRQRDKASAQAQRSAERRYQIECVDLPEAVRQAHESWKPTVAALIAPGKARVLPDPEAIDDPVHCVQYEISPFTVAMDHGDTVVASTVDRLLKQFQAEGYTPRTIVIRVQDW